MNNGRNNRRWARFSLRTLLLIVTVVAVGLYGKQRWDNYQKLKTAEAWVDAAITELDGHSSFYYGQESPVHQISAGCPNEKLETAGQIAVLVHGALNLQTTRRQTCCLKILAEQFPAVSLNAFIRIAHRSDDVEIQATAIHLASLYRDVDSLQEISSILEQKDVSPRVRAAVIDCIGFIRQPTYDLGPLQAQYTRFYDGQATCLDCKPSIWIGPIIETNWTTRPFSANQSSNQLQTDVEQAQKNHIHVVYLQQGYSLLGPDKDFPDSYREHLQRTMLEGESAEERIAAARAIIAWPPADYELRLAEWGVWINLDGQFHLAQTVIDEIPAFVHRTGNELESFEGRLTIPMIVTKPVIHLTVDQPMAIDLEVTFYNGRPWFAFPKPDDFNLQTEWPGPRRQPAISKFDDSTILPLTGIREGYPWLLPHHRQHYTVNRTVKDEIAGLGLRWQSLIISPSKLPWMNPPEVNNGTEFQWWKNLRDVPCSWVSNLGESERFVYYDGPTLANSPIKVSLADDVLQIDQQKIFPDQGSVINPRRAIADNVRREEPDRIGFFVRVDDQGIITGQKLDLDNKKIDLHEVNKIDGAKIRQKLLDLLINAGLNSDEARALLDCWESAFFKTAGQRLIFLLQRSEYDLMCPIKVRPMPTTMARVGLVLTELLATD